LQMPSSGSKLGQKAGHLADVGYERSVPCDCWASEDALAGWSPRSSRMISPTLSPEVRLRWPLRGDLRCLPYTTFDPLSRCRYAAYAGLKSAEKLKMTTNLSEDPETGLKDLATEGQKERREFLYRCGQFAVVTPPAMATLTCRREYSQGGSRLYHRARAPVGVRLGSRLAPGSQESVPGIHSVD
jgi:hypothetical protein